MSLSIPRFSLPDSTGLAKIGEFQKLGGRLDTLMQTAGASSGWFKQRCAEVKQLAQSGQPLSDIVDQPRDSRVVLHLWEHDESFLKANPPTAKLLSKLRDVAVVFRAGHLSSLIEIYFRYFDHLEQVSAIAKTVSECLGSSQENRLTRSLRQLRANASVLFEPRAPEFVAHAARQGEDRFRDLMRDMGVPVERPGRFMEACKHQYFVQTVGELEPGQSHKVFREIIESKQSPFDPQLNLGQKVSGVMIDRCEKRADGMPKVWVDTVIGIMGDPRRGQRSPAYQKWWAPMSPRQVRLVKKWLAGADLRLFLEILEDSASDEALQRMYPDRKAFLEGLLEHYDIEHARLFLGDSAAHYITKKFSRDAIRAHGRLRDLHKTVIHLQIEGVHLFEGTHNYAARLARYLPEDSRVLNYAIREFTYQDLTSSLELELKEAARGHRNAASARVVHSNPLSWQHRLISEFHRLGVRVHPEYVLTERQYYAYRRKFGVGP